MRRTFWRKPARGTGWGMRELVDALIKDGLLDVYNNFLMGNAAELCAKECQVPREAQDEFAILSYTRAQDAQRNGRFRNEIVGGGGRADERATR